MIVVDVNEITANVTPPRLRSDEWLEFQGVLLSIHNSLMNRFYEEYYKRIYYAAFTGQVIYLEKLLNDKYDSVLRRIKIQDSLVFGSSYVFNDSEGNESLYLFNDSESEDYFLNNNNEYFISFVIQIPTGLLLNYNELKSLVNKYKLKSKQYIIKEI